MPHRLHPIRAWRLPDAAPAATGQAAALDALLDQHLVRALGAIPLLLPILDRLGLRAVVNRACQPADHCTTDLDPGLVTVVLVLNRLLAPQPLVHVESWLAETALPDLMGLTADQCNDDRLARVLDALVPHLDALWQALEVAAITQFQLDLRQLCYDITSIAFCGAYDDASLITYGYSRDHRADRQQLELAATVTGAGGVPVDYRVLAGNVADRTTPVENLRRLQELLALLPARNPAQQPLVISDRAMLTAEALAAFVGSGLHALGPLDPSMGHGAVRRLLAAESATELAAHPLGYRPQRAAHDPAWEPYQGVLHSLELPHPDPEQPPLRLRALVVWSPGKARLDAQLRQTQLTRLVSALQDLAPKLGRRPYTTTAAVERRVATLLRRHPARSYLQVTVGTSDQGPTLTWSLCEEALAAAAARDGRYVLSPKATRRGEGCTDETLDAEQMLAQAKQRDLPEKRFALVKGPLAVRPVYLHKPGRILALVFCTMVALLVFALLELEARRAGLRQSGVALLAQFAPLGVLELRFQDGSSLRRLTGLRPKLTAILAVLGLPPPERWLAQPA